MTKELTMPKPYTGVYKRPKSARWQLRIKVPADLISIYKSEWAYRGSLDTSDLREANERASTIWSEWLRRFEQQRRELNPQRAEKVTSELAQVVAQRVASALLKMDEKLRSDPEGARTLLLALDAAVPSKLTIRPAPVPAWASGPLDPLEGLPEEMAAKLQGLNAALDERAARLLSAQRLTAMLPLAQAEARKLGVEFDASTPGAVDLLRGCLKAYRKSWQDIRKRDAGEVVETPAAPLSTSQNAKQSGSATPLTLRDVFERWKKVKKRSEDTVRACERALALFEGHAGTPAVQLITRAQGDDFRGWLQTLGTSSKTAHDRLTWVKSLLVYAKRDLEAIHRQPWEGIEIEHRTEKPRKPWTAEELQAFFSLPLFTSYELPRTTSKNGGDAAYWIPLMGLYTGARVGELCQLRVQDVQTTEDGPFISITEEAEGATVKTAAGIRRVPIHPELVRLGFLEYVQHMRDAGATSLWPSLRFREGKPGGYFSEWVNTFHRSATSNPAAPVFHALRHTVRTALHRARVDPLATDLIIGHESSGLKKVQKTYTHLSDADLVQAIVVLRYPAAEKLPKVFRLPSRRTGATTDNRQQPATKKTGAP